MTFSFIDPGFESMDSFRTHLDAYLTLFTKLSQLRFYYVATRETNFERANKLFQGTLQRLWNPEAPCGLFAYFRTRRTWDEKNFGRLKDHDVLFINQGKERFGNPGFENLYQRWRAWEITENTVRSESVKFQMPWQVTLYFRNRERTGSVVRAAPASASKRGGEKFRGDIFRDKRQKEQADATETARKRSAAKTRSEAGATPSCRRIAARSLRASGVTPASCCWNPQLVFWPRRKRAIGEFVRQHVRQDCKGGTKRKRGNHQGTTQTTKIGDDPGTSGGVGENAARSICKIHRLHSVLRHYRGSESPIQTR